MAEPMEQLLLFGELHPGEAAYYAEVAVHKGWHVAAEQVMTYLAKSGREFTAVDVRQLLDGAPQPAQANPWGGLFTSWRNRGLIEAVGTTRPARPERNGGIIAVWRGTTKMTK